ncbi:(deoxy)nucleoside triphosphate pyrophosphohydrolase [Pseudobacteriovorax antillogorgiicola]|uniref:(deoxy)nucleoside triphosphate pyrophosphohydrolase n=1 Tax=Pseudobacteriovorax antillogorgiicola TaxID=1513793 RepID=UPI001053DC35|nr:(deoxy)nucleoside triphosphate pyrophosphohydrolase [Pseudobacteriovorax antillogorgiicola]
MDVVCALMAQKNTYFVAKRADHKASGGRWEFPGGKVEEGESPAEAIIRELAEELDVQSAVEQVLEPILVEKKNFALRLIPVKVSIQGTILLKEHSDGRWLSPSDLLGLDLCEGDREIVHRYLIGGSM